MSNLNWVDIIILVIFLASVLAGLIRGFVKEIISLLTWIAAFVIAVMFASKLAAWFTSMPSVQSMIASASNSIGTSAETSVSYIALGISFLLLFVCTLIIGSIISTIISRAIESVGIGFINRLLGGVFGLARGFLIVVAGIFLVQLTSAAQQPWWAQSQFVNSFQPAVAWVGGMVSPGLASLKERVSNTMQNGGQMIQQGIGNFQNTGH